jgi:hypothetical protein
MLSTTPLRKTTRVTLRDTTWSDSIENSRMNLDSEYPSLVRFADFDLSYLIVADFRSFAMQVRVLHVDAAAQCDQ